MAEQVVTIRTVDALDVALARAGIGSRAYAFLIDWHIRAIAAATWFLVALYVLGIGVRESFEEMAYGAVIPAVLIYALYHPVLEVLMRGQTPGKRWTHLRIVDTAGNTPGPGALIVRNVFRLVDSLPALYAVGLLVMLCTRDQVRIGDLAAGTVVVHELAEPAAGLGEAVVHERLPPRVAQMLEEWLERWPDLEPAQRDAIARTLLSRAADPALAESARRLDGVALRDHVRQALGNAARGP